MGFGSGGYDDLFYVGYVLGGVHGSIQHSSSLKIMYTQKIHF
jgi:hypothetical protein